MKILRNVAGIIIGIFCGALVTFFIERLGHENLSIYRNVPDMTEEVAFATFIADLPRIALLILILAHSIGTLIAGFIASLLTDESRPKAATAVGVIMLSLGIINFIDIPSHPVWFQVAEVIIYIPSAILGFRLKLMAKALQK